MKQQKKHAALSVADVDVNLPDPPPEGIEHGKPVLTTQRSAAARIAIREKTGGAMRHGRPSQLPSMPGINALAFTTRYIPGGRKRFLEFVKLAAANGDPSATAWWTVFTDLPAVLRTRVPLDDVCEASGVKPGQLLAGVVGHGMEAMTDMGNLVAAALHPEVIAAAGRSAMRIDGDHASIAAEDRKQLLQARGFLPVPKGNSIYLTNSVSANAQAASASKSEPSVPKFGADMSFLTAARDQVQKQLESEAPPVESEFVDAAE